MYEPWMALLLLAFAGLLVAPIGLFGTWLERRRAARGPHNTPAE